MSSIAYVTDEQMMEYHRLCGNRDMNFWRLSPKTEFTDFKPGDLLFFYARTPQSRRRAFVGYAHFRSASVLTLKQMWNRFEKKNGYDNIEQMKRAIESSSRDHQVPAKMSCLYLDGAVFFRSPIDPRDAGIKLSSSLESFTYIDQGNPGATVRILKIAQSIGVNDFWSASLNEECEQQFGIDMMDYQMAEIAARLAPLMQSKSAAIKAGRLMQSYLAAHSDFRPIAGSADAYRFQHGTLTLALSFVYSARQKNALFQQLIGRYMSYQVEMRREAIAAELVDLEVVTEEKDAQVETWLKELKQL